MLEKSNTYVDDQIARIVVVMQETEVHTKEYGELLTRLERLQEIRKNEKPDKVSHNTLVTVAGNLAGILLILKHENVNVITSKALGLILKPRT